MKMYQTHLYLYPLLKYMRLFRSFVRSSIHSFIPSFIHSFIHSFIEQVQEYTTQDLVDNALKGFNCALFAYGQTSSGKQEHFSLKKVLENLDRRFKKYLNFEKNKKSNPLQSRNCLLYTSPSPRDS